MQDAPRADAPRLLRAGIILLALSLVNGFAIDALPLPRLALSAHLVGLMGSMFLIALSACWPALAFSRRASRVARVVAVYGFCGGWTVYLFAAATGSGGMFPMAGRGARGTPLQEAFSGSVLLTVAIALFVLCGVVLKGLCSTPPETDQSRAAGGTSRIITRDEP